MSLVHLHLLLNHIPVIGTAFALLLLAWGMLRKQDAITKIALVAFVILALLAIPTFLTGDPAEDVVAKLPGVTKAAIERHDNAAGVALTAMEVLGGISLLGLIFFRRAPRLPQAFTTVALLAGIVVGGLMAYTANLGGQIRHSEIAGAAVAGGQGSVQVEHDD